MTFNLGSIEIQIEATRRQLDRVLDSIERDKARFESKPFKANIGVNTSGLYLAQTQIETTKNRFRNAQDYFNSNPLTPKVNSSELDKLDAKLSKFENKTYQVKVEVDDSRLTDLNAHYDLKSRDHRKLQKQLTSEPLTLRVNDSALGNMGSSGNGKQIKNIQEIIHKSGDKKECVSDLKEISQTLKPINSILRQIASNTKKPGLISRSFGGLTNAVLGNATRGLFMEFGGQFAQQVINEVGNSAGGQKATETTRNLARRTGEIVGNAAGQYSEIFFGGSRRRGDAVETMGNDILNAIETIIDPSKLDSKTSEIRKKIFEIFTKVDAGMLDSLGAIQEVGTSVINQNPRIAKNAAFRTAQVGAFPLKVQKEYQNAKAARIIEEFVSNLERARRVIAKNSEGTEIANKDNIVITSGGFERKKGSSSQQTSEMLRPFFDENTAFLEIKNTSTDRYGGEPQSKTFELVKSVLEPMGISVAGEMKSMLSNLEIIMQSAFKGMNPDAVKMAVAGHSIKTLFPDKNVSFAGFSGGGFVVEQAVSIMEALKDLQTKGIGIGTPFYGLTNTARPEQFQSIVGYTDPQTFAYDKDFANYPEKFKRKANQGLAAKGLDPSLANLAAFQVPEIVQLVGRNQVLNHDVWSYLQNSESYDTMAQMLPGMKPGDFKLNTDNLPQNLQNKYQDLLPDLAGIDDPLFGSRKNKVTITRLAKANRFLNPKAPSYNPEILNNILDKNPEQRTTAETKKIDSYIANVSEQFLKTFTDFETQLNKTLTSNAKKIANNIVQKKGITDKGEIKTLQQQVSGFFTDYFKQTTFKQNLEANKAQALKILGRAADEKLTTRGIDTNKLDGLQKTGLVNFLTKRETDDLNLLRGLDIYKNRGTSDIKSNYEFFNFANPKAKIDLEMQGMRDYVVEPNKRVLQGTEFEGISSKYSSLWENLQAGLARFVATGEEVPDKLLAAAEKILAAKDKLADFDFPDLIKSGELKKPQEYFNSLAEGAKKIAFASDTTQAKLSSYEKRNLAELNRRIGQNNRDNPDNQIPFVRVRDTVPLGTGQNGTTVLEQATNRVIKFAAPATDPLQNTLEQLPKTFPQTQAAVDFISQFLPERNIAGGFPQELANITRASQAGLTKPLPNAQVDGFMMMQLQEGKPLVNAASSLKGGDPEEIIRFLESIVRAGALAREFHNAGFAHRDLHLNNIFQTTKGDIAPIDFGAMRELPTNERERNIAIAEDVNRAIKHSQGLLQGKGIDINPSLLGEAYRRGVKSDAVSISGTDIEGLEASREIAEKLYAKFSNNLPGKALIGSATKSLPESTPQKLGSQSVQNASEDFINSAFNNVKQTYKYLATQHKKLKGAKDLAQMQAYIDDFNKTIDLFNNSIHEAKKLNPASDRKVHARIGGHVSSVSQLRDRVVETVQAKSRQFKIDPTTIDVKAVRVPELKALPDLSANADKSAKNWQDTSKNIENNLNDLESKSGEIGYKIQKNISKGSPGMLTNVERHWRNTVQLIAGNLAAIQQQAGISGSKVQQFLTGEGSRKNLFKSHAQEILADIQRIKRAGETAGTSIDESLGNNEQFQKNIKSIEHKLQEFLKREHKLELLLEDEKIRSQIEDSFGSIDDFVKSVDANAVLEDPDLSGLKNASSELTEIYKYSLDSKSLWLEISKLATGFASSLEGEKDPLKGLNQVKKVYDSVITGLPDTPTLFQGVRNFTDEMSRVSPVFRNVLDFGGQVATLAVAGFGFNAAANNIVNFTKESTNAARNLERFDILMTGVGRNGQETFDKLFESSQKIGTSFGESVEGYKKLFLSTQGTEGESLVDPVFSGFQKGFASAQATREQQQLGYIALEQMISKGGLTGSVYSEELRRQLGNSLPGAMTTAAIVRGQDPRQLTEDLRNQNVPTGDLLTKMAAFYEVDREIVLKLKSSTFESELNRLDNNLEYFRAQAGKAIIPFGKQGLRATNAGLSLMSNHMGTISTISGGVLLVGLYNLSKAMYAVTMQTRLGSIAMKTFGIESLVALQKQQGIIGVGKAGFNKSLGFAKPIAAAAIAVTATTGLQESLTGGQRDVIEANKLSKRLKVTDSRKQQVSEAGGANSLSNLVSESINPLQWFGSERDRARNDFSRIASGSERFQTSLAELDNNIDLESTAKTRQELEKIAQQIAILKGERLTLVTSGETVGLREIEKKIGNLRKDSKNSSKELFADLAKAQRIEKGLKTFDRGLERIKAFVPESTYLEGKDKIGTSIIDAQATIKTLQSFIDNNSGKQLTYLTRKINRELGNIEYQLDVDLSQKSTANIKRKIAGLLTDRELDIASSKNSFLSSQRRTEELFNKREELRAELTAGQKDAVRNLLGVGSDENFFAALDRIGVSGVDIEDKLTGTEDPLLKNILNTVKREREINLQAQQSQSATASQELDFQRKERELIAFETSRPALESKAFLESQISAANLAGDLDQLKTNMQLLSSEIPLASNSLHSLRNDISTLKDVAAAKVGNVRDLSLKVNDFSSDSRQELRQILGTDNLAGYASHTSPEALEAQFSALSEEQRRTIENSGEIQGLVEAVKLLSEAHVTSRQANLQLQASEIQLKQTIQDYETQLFGQLQQLESSVISNDQTLFQQSRSIEQFVWSLRDYSFGINQAIKNLKLQIRNINAATTQSIIQTPETFFNAANVNNNPLTKYLTTVTSLIGQAEQIGLSNRVPYLEVERSQKIRDYDRQIRQFGYQKEDLGFSINNEIQTTAAANRQLRRDLDLFLGQENITSEEAKQFSSSLVQQYDFSNQQVDSIRQLGSDNFTPINLSKLSFSGVFDGGDPNSDSFRKAYVEATEKLIQANEQKISGLQDISDTGLSRILEEELQIKQSHAESLKTINDQIRSENEKQEAEIQKFAARIEGTRIALEKLLTLGASGIEIQTNQQEFRTRDVILQANRGFYNNLNQENIGEYAQLKTRNSINSQLQQLRAGEIDATALLDNIGLATNKDDLIAKINDPSNITDPLLKQKLLNILEDPAFEGDFSPIIQALTEQRDNARKNIDKLNTEAPELIQNAGVLAEEQQQLRIKRSITGARKGLLEEQKKAKILDPFEEATTSREIGQIQIELDYQSQLSNARRQFGALTKEFERAQAVLEELREIKLDNLERQTKVIGKTLEDSVDKGFGKVLDGFKDGIDSLDELWRNFGIGFLEVWANVAQQFAQQKLIELIFREKGEKNSTTGGIGGFIGDVVTSLAIANDGLMIQPEHIPNFFNGSGINPLSLYAGVKDAYHREQSLGGQPVLVMASVGERILNARETAAYNQMEAQGIVDAWQSTGIEPNNYQINNYNSGGTVGQSVSHAFSHFTHHNSSHRHSVDSHDHNYFDFTSGNSRRDRLGRSSQQRARAAFEQAKRQRQRDGLD